MSYYSGNTPPILAPPAGSPPFPGYGGPVIRPPSAPNYRLPPWFPPVVTSPMPRIPAPTGGDLPPTPEQEQAALADGRMYPAGPFCFGLDKVICEQLPRQIRIGAAENSMLPGFWLPLWGFCGVLLNTLCGVLMAIIILTLLGIAFYGLLQ